MSDKPEPLAAILAEMREYFDLLKRGLIPDNVARMTTRQRHQFWADRIEAAAERERASLENALSHCREYAEKIERENEEGETRLDAEEIIATVDNEFAGIRPARATGDAAAMRHALERILDIEGYGAPWIEDKVIAQKALEGEQCTHPLAQERPKIEQPGNAAAVRDALERSTRRLQGVVRELPLEMQKYVNADIRDNDAALAAPPRNCDRFATLGEARDYFFRNCFVEDETRSSATAFAEWLFAHAEGGEKCVAPADNNNKEKNND